MTCIVGLVDNGDVWMGADSAAARDWELRHRSDPKVFRNGPFLLGFTTSFRMGQLLRFAFKPPAPPRRGNLDRFLATTWIDAVRKCLTSGGFAKKKDAVESGGEFLVGVSGHLFIVYCDYQIGESRDRMDAVGCGSDLALGALFATAGMRPRQRIRIALEAAEHFSSGVIRPFKILSLKHERTAK